MFPEVVSTIEAELRRLEEELTDVEATRKRKKAEVRRIKRMLRLANDDTGQRRRIARVGNRRSETSVAASA